MRRYLIDVLGNKVAMRPEKRISASAVPSYPKYILTSEVVCASAMNPAIWGLTPDDWRTLWKPGGNAVDGRLSERFSGKLLSGLNPVNI
jgi:hypothetical protein